MLSVKLPKTLEKQLRRVVQKNYQGDLQIAIVAFLKLHEKYGWKEQFLKDVEAIREEVRRRGGIKKAKTIDDAVKRYRKSIGESRA
jgi:flavodoxin